MHHHDFDELVIVWRGNGLHLWNDVPYRMLPAAICSMFPRTIATAMNPSTRLNWTIFSISAIA
ncbi:hypothetical protein [Pectobacterium polonicum]|uniref:hypothetical protein n=1 Tax=Pectobacterium polonicum TaxID=2485124 RepID=UPI0037541F45